MAEYIESFLAIKPYDNIYGLRYEDIRYRPHETYRHLLTWLGFEEETLVHIEDDVLDRIIHLGTFDAQSGGRYKEGNDNATSIFSDGDAVISCGLRKGIQGDWKNHFSPRVVEKVKQIAGPGLIELGYETSLDW